MKFVLIKIYILSVLRTYISKVIFYWDNLKANFFLNTIFLHENVSSETKMVLGYSKEDLKPLFWVIWQAAYSVVFIFYISIPFIFLKITLV